MPPLIQISFTILYLLSHDLFIFDVKPGYCIVQTIIFMFNKIIKLTTKNWNMSKKKRLAPGVF